MNLYNYLTKFKIYLKKYVVNLIKKKNNKFYNNFFTAYMKSYKSHLINKI